jgi:hypothetical protein
MEIGIMSPDSAGFRRCCRGGTHTDTLLICKQIKGVYLR